VFAATYDERGRRRFRNAEVSENIEEVVDENVSSQGEEEPSVFRDNDCVTSAGRAWVEGRSDENGCSRKSNLQSSVVV
jgi:hypothetical protein